VREGVEPNPMVYQSPNCDEISLVKERELHTDMSITQEVVDQQYIHRINRHYQGPKKEGEGARENTVDRGQYMVKYPGNRRVRERKQEGEPK